jgi:hypothetical protein
MVQIISQAWFYGFGLNLGAGSGHCEKVSWGSSITPEMLK